jgi:polysaccharide export outer membrane protein/exopolysaccharide production protein ExoF
MKVNVQRLLLGLIACGLFGLIGPGGRSATAQETGQTRVAQPGAAVPYRLGAGDKISVKVLEWRPSVDQIYAWEALNVKYTIGPAGQLALPLVGELPAAGLTTNELAQQISEQLRLRMQLAAPPDATVEIVEYRPFYLVGAVEKPGQYPYEPGMTVLRAISIGGGLVRARDITAMRLQREAISSRGDLDVLLSELDALIARNARLEAELAGKDEIAFPPALTEQKDQPPIARIMEQEKLIFDARKQAFGTQMSALRQLRSYLDEEVKSLKSQIEVHKTQQKLVTEELEKVRGLASKGLTTGTRQLELERISAQLEGDGLRLEGSLIRTRQDISRTDISILELDNRRKGEITVDLRESKRMLDQVQTKRNTAAKLVYEAEVIAPGLLLEDDTGPGAQMTYKIVRKADDQYIELTADENTAVLPGDTIKIAVAKKAPRKTTDGVREDRAPAASKGVTSARPAPASQARAQ